MAARETISEVLLALQRVFTNLTVNMVLSVVLDRITPAYSSSRNPWIQAIEGAVSISAQVLMVPTLTDAVLPFYGNSQTDMYSRSLLGPWFMPRSMLKLQALSKKLYVGSGDCK